VLSYEYLVNPGGCTLVVRTQTAKLCAPLIFWRDKRVKLSHGILEIAFAQYHANHFDLNTITMNRDGTSGVCFVVIKIYLRLSTTMCRTTKSCCLFCNLCANKSKEHDYSPPNIAAAARAPAAMLPDTGPAGPLPSPITGAGRSASSGFCDFNCAAEN